MTYRQFSVCATLLAICGVMPLAAADAVGPFQWTRKLLDADPALQTPQDTAANGVIESALLTPGGTASQGSVTLTQWTATNMAGSYSSGGNTLRGQPGKSYAIGMNGWTNYEGINTGDGWIKVARMQQDAKLTLLYIGANQTPPALKHGATLTVDSPMPAPALALTLIFRRVQGGQGDSGWQTGWYNGNPLSMSVTEIPQGKSLSQAQAEPSAVRRLATLDALTEITPDMPFQVELRTAAGGLWQASLDLDGDGTADVDLESGVNGAKPYTVGDIDQSGGLYVTASPAMGSPTGTVGVSTFNLTYRETFGTWQSPLRNRRPIKIARNHSSRVSPAVIQGGAWKADRTVSITPVGTLDRFSNGMFLAKVPLDAPTEGAQVVVSQSGTPSTDVPVSIQWQATSISAGGTYTIKKGDSLLLVADDGYTDGRAMLIDPYGTGQDIRTGSDETKHAAIYNQTGAYSAIAYDDANNDGIGSPSEVIGTIAIQVVNFALPAYVPNQTAFAREFLVDTAPINAADVQLRQAAGSSITVGNLDASWSSIRTTLKPSGNNEPVLQATTVDGTILDSRSISTFSFSMPTGSVIAVKKNFPDKSVILDGILQLAPLRPDLDVNLSIYVTGASFPDGGLKLTCRSNDFSIDAAGVGTQHYDLIRSGKITSGPCHSAKVYFTSTIVGQ